VRFDIHADKGGNYSWRLIARNGQQVCWAGESFASKSNAERAARAFRTGAANARFEVYEDAGGHWRWRAHRGGHKVAASGEAFASKSNAQRAADNVRDKAADAAEV